MGQGCSIFSDDRKRDRKIAKQLKSAQKSEVHKLLLLGPGESGKSTIFKQAHVLFNHGFEKASDREAFVPAIYANCIEGIKKLIVESLKSEGNLFDVEDSVSFVMKMSLSDVITHTGGAHIKTLWAHPTIRETFSKRSKFQLGDSVQYFLRQIERISAQNYIPTTDDIIRSRVRTTGIVEKVMRIGQAKFNVVDVGGQRGERRKWIHCFEGVQAVLYVCAISEYNQTLTEDETTNRLEEALKLFQSITGLSQFSRTAIIIFLNKSDLFAEKLERKEGDLRNVFPQYKGGHDFDKATDFLTKIFRDAAPDHERDELLYFHVTCATNTDNMDTVLCAVEDFVTRQNLRLNELL